ncbi:hypothetical protein EVAR_100382_1 [Eumeta japonica]|uniref:Uncharacterized protein n=1 Tax=Eumeta variegata TaxID=151549 RepID=A0A4C1ZW35_EUMVA|nr:hypothetical protein EVAR_100382_1 [Eumeta japonica]
MTLAEGTTVDFEAFLFNDTNISRQRNVTITFRIRDCTQSKSSVKASSCAYATQKANKRLCTDLVQKRKHIQAFIPVTKIGYSYRSHDFQRVTPYEVLQRRPREDYLNYILANKQFQFGRLDAAAPHRGGRRPSSCSSISMKPTPAHFRLRESDSLRRTDTSRRPPSTKDMQFNLTQVKNLLVTSPLISDRTRSL